jgi:hypothetical protein
LFGAPLGHREQKTPPTRSGALPQDIAVDERRGKPLLGGAHSPFAWLARHLEIDLDVPIPHNSGTGGARPGDREPSSPRARPYQRFHVEFGDCLATDAGAMPALVMRADQKAADADAPAELLGFAKGVDSHKNTMRTYLVAGQAGDWKSDCGAETIAGKEQYFSACDQRENGARKSAVLQALLWRATIKVRQQRQSG